MGDESHPIGRVESAGLPRVERVPPPQGPAAQGTWSALCTQADIPHSKAPSPQKTLHKSVPTVAAADLLVCSDQTLHFCSIRKNCLG